MPVGNVKWFDNKKGYGFIEKEGSADIFVHYSNIVSDGYKTLQKGETVEFELVEGEKGLQAEKVKRLEE